MFGRFCKRKFEEETTAELRKAIQTHINRIDDKIVKIQEKAVDDFADVNK